MTTTLPTLAEARKLMTAEADRYGYGPDGVMPGDENEIGEACWWLAKARRSQANEASDYEAIGHECAAIADGQPAEARKLAAAAVTIAAADIAICRKHAAYWRSPIKAAADPKGSAKWGDAWAAHAEQIEAAADELTTSWLAS